jgi:hypothetical protein
MATWRTLGVLALILSAAAPLPAQTYPLIETPQVGDCFRVHLDMKLNGEMRITREEQKVPIVHFATATHDYLERVLLLGPNGWPSKNARHYEKATISISAGSDKSERTLRPERHLIVAQQGKEQFLCYCPEGPLTRPELELVSEHLDTMALPSLLPGKAVTVGETWKLSNPVVQAMCAFEGLMKQELTGKLEAVEGNVARISITGTAEGIDLGAIVKMTLQATCRYDLEQKRIVGLEWKRREESEQGPATPALNVETTTTLTRSSIAQPKELCDAALIAVPEKDPGKTDPMLQVYYPDRQDRFSLIHCREWQTVLATKEHVIMRLMDRGEFIAQVTLTPWDKAEAGKHMSGKDLLDIMDNVPGWEAAERREDGELSADQEGYWIYRISALGELEGLKVMQNYFVVAGPKGDQMLMVFTMKQAVVDKFGTRDLELARGLEFPDKK